jgi:hypothetical protein
MVTTMTHAARCGARHALPARPSLERLKHQARQRLSALRQTQTNAKLADAQFELARAYGFASWRELKAEVDRRRAAASMAAADCSIGDWIGMAGPNQRIALHIHPDPDGILSGAIDDLDYKLFDLPIDGLTVEAGRMRFTARSPSFDAVYEACWDAARRLWVGEYLTGGLKFPLDFRPGWVPPSPVAAGLDGFWDGRLEAEGKIYPLTFRVRTDAHGTYAHLDHPAGVGTSLPVAEVSREGDQVGFAMRTIRVEGALSPDADVIEGLYVIGDGALPLRLQRRAKGAPAPLPPRPAEMALPADQLEALAGTYRSRAGDCFVFKTEGGRLVASTNSGHGVELAAVSPTFFLSREAELTVIFELGPTGRGDRVGLRKPGCSPVTGLRDD